MSAVFDDIRQVEPAPEYAGLFSWFKKLRFRPAQPKAAPKAGSPETATFDTISDAVLPETDAYGRKEPSISDQGPSLSESLKTDLLNSIANIWKQATVNLDAFEKIKNFRTEESPIPGTMAIVNDEDDIIYFGINPKDGSHAVMSPANISARHALEQVYVALTDDLMREEGIDDVDGTDLDKALLCLAAEKNGLKINNMPVLSDDVKAEALKLWQEAFPEQAPTTAPAPEASAPEASAAPAAEKVIKVDGTDVLPAVAADREMAPAPKTAQGQVIDGEVTVVEPKAPLTALEDKQAPTNETPPSVIIMGYTPDTPAQAPLALEAPVAEAPAIKPAALDILRGETAENSVAPETFQSFVSDLKSGKFSDELGMLSEDTIRATFNRQVGNKTEADIMMEAAAAQGVVYNTTRTVPAMRMTVNPHVPPAPVRHDPNKPKMAP